MLSRKRIITIAIILLLVFVYIDVGLIADNQGMATLFDIDLSYSGSLDWSANGDYQYRSEISGEEVFDGDGLTDLRVENSFGEVIITGEQRDDIRIDYRIEVKAATEELLEKTAEEVALDLNQANQELEISTLKPDNREQVNISTYLTIRVPEELAVDLYSRFDDINLKNIAGQVAIDNSYGDVEISEVTGPLEIEASFSDYKINSVQEKITGNLSYTEVVIDQLSSDLELDLQFSGLDLYLKDTPESWSYDLRTNYGSIKSRYDFQLTEDGTEVSYYQNREGLPLIRLDGRFTDITIH